MHDELHTRGRTAEEAAQRAVLFQRRLAITKAMDEAGVRQLAGTANPTVFGFHGFDLHQELALFVTAGLTPMRALQTATLEPARFLGTQHVQSTVEPGKHAELVALDADPLADIRNTARIHAVVVAGQLIGPERRQRMLADIEATAAVAERVGAATTGVAAGC